MWGSLRNHQAEMQMDCTAIDVGIHLNTVCSCCKVKGHLERVCMKKTAGKKPDSVSSGGKLRHAKTHHIEEKRDEDNIGNITVEEICMVVSRSDDAKLWATVTVNGIPLRLEMDTGCPVSIINAECYGQFFQNITRRGSTLMLACYCDSNINVQGFFYAEVEYHGARKVVCYGFH